MSDATIITLNAALRAVMPALQIEWRFFLHFNSKEHEVLLLRKLKVHDMILHIRIAIACLLLLLTSLYLNAQTTTWQRLYDGTSNFFDGGMDLAASDSSNLYLVGFTTLNSDVVRCHVAMQAGITECFGFRTVCRDWERHTY